LVAPFVLGGEIEVIGAWTSRQRRAARGGPGDGRRRRSGPWSRTPSPAARSRFRRL